MHDFDIQTKKLSRGNSNERQYSFFIMKMFQHPLLQKAIKASAKNKSFSMTMHLEIFFVIYAILFYLLHVVSFPRVFIKKLSTTIN